MNSPDHFWLELQKLFTVVAHVNHSGVLVRSSPLLTDQCGWHENEAVNFFETFTFKRPTPFDGSYAAAQSAVGQLFLGFSDELGFAVRGQVVDYSAMGLDGLCFVGVPWLWWMEGNAPNQALTLSDFPVHDVQMDQLFFMSTQQSMVDDLQALNEQLKEAKHEVEVANEARQTFFHHVSHEMRTPLNGVISALSLMKDFNLEGKLADYARLATQSADRLLEVINFTLESASLESHVSEAELTAFNLDELIDECLLLASPRAIEQGLELRRSGSQKFDRPYRGRLQLLRQVLGNLLSNAVKFSKSGTITMGAIIREGLSREDSDILEFSVADQGPGIPEEAREKLFLPFTTGLSAETAAVQGTGLGLSIVQRFVEALGGDIEVQSSMGEGSIFRFEIPLAHATDDEQLETFMTAALGGAERYDGRVLLVDDNEINRLLNAKVLESMSLNVVTAGSGNEALEWLAAHSSGVDLVFMDLDMPDIDGLEVTRRIRGLPGLDSLPVFALTAHTSPENRRRTHEVGMEGMLGKPLDLDELRTALGQHLSRMDKDVTTECFDAAQPQVSDLQALPRTDGDTVPNNNLTPEERAQPDPEVQMGQTNSESVVVFDREPIDRLIKEVGVGVLQTLVDKFLRESAERWEALRQAMVAADRDTIVRESHTLGSACLTFGIAAAGGCFRQCEASAIENNLPDDSTLQPIATLLGEGIGELQQFLSEQGG